MGICRFLRSSILLVCMASLTLAVITMSGVEILGMCSYCVYLVRDNDIGALNSPSRGKCTLEKHSTFPNASLALHASSMFCSYILTRIQHHYYVLGLYLRSFVCMAQSRNLSWVKVNLMIQLVRSSVCISGSFCSYVAPCMYMMSSLKKIVRHSYFVLLHVQMSMHSGMMLYCCFPYWLPILMGVRCLVCTFDLIRWVS